MSRVLEDGYPLYQGIEFDRVELIKNLANQQHVNRQTRAGYEGIIGTYDEEELVGFINKATDAEINVKPVLYFTALEKLKRLRQKELGKLI